MLGMEAVVGVAVGGLLGLRVGLNLQLPLWLSLGMRKLLVLEWQTLPRGTGRGGRWAGQQRFVDVKGIVMLLAALMLRGLLLLMKLCREVVTNSKLGREVVPNLTLLPVARLGYALAIAIGVALIDSALDRETGRLRGKEGGASAQRLDAAANHPLVPWYDDQVHLPIAHTLEQLLYARADLSIAPRPRL